MGRKSPHLNSGQSHLTACILIVLILPGMILGGLRINDRLQRENEQENRVSQVETGRDLRRWIQSWWPWSQDWDYYTSVPTDLKLYGVQFSYDPDWRLSELSDRVLMIVPTLEEETAGLLNVPVESSASLGVPTVQEDLNQSLGFVLVGLALQLVLDRSLVDSSMQITVQGRPATIYRLNGRSDTGDLPDWFSREVRIDVINIDDSRQIGFVFSDQIKGADAQRMVDSVQWSFGNE